MIMQKSLYRLVRILRQVKPVVATFQFCVQQGSIVVGIYRQARQQEAVVAFSGSPDHGAHAVLIVDFLQQARYAACEISILLWECEGISERSDRLPDIVFNGMFGKFDFIFQRLGISPVKIGMGCGVRADLDAILTDFADFPPSHELFRTYADLFLTDPCRRHV